jgi:anti-sigma B factor antagonist
VAGPAQASFEVVEARLRGAAGVAVRGDIDIEAVPALERSLDDAIREGAGVFVLDLCDVEFLDSSGCRLLLRAQALLAREERALAVVCPPGPVRRVLEQARVADLLFLFATREEAAAALIPGD